MDRIRAVDVDARVIEQVVASLEAGGVVCFPTDTVFGLAVDPRNEEALDRIFQLKGRSSTKPLLVLVDSIRMARSLSVSNPWLDRLAAEFWPGPLTMVTPSAGTLPEKLTAGTGAIGMRWPDQSLPTRIINAFGHPITATSANRSGHAPALSAEEAIDQFGAGLDILIEGESPTGSTPSTVLDLTTEPPTLLRDGRIRWSRLERFMAESFERSAG